MIYILSLGLREDYARVVRERDAFAQELSEVRLLLAESNSSLRAMRTAFQSQAEAFEQLREELANLQRRFLPKRKTESMRPPKTELAKREGRPEPPEGTRERRASRRRKREEIPTEVIVERVPEEARTCSACGNAKLETVGDGQPSRIYEWVPGYFVCREHRLETLACTCGDYIVRAEPPARPYENAQYGPGFLSHVVVSKCVDALPLHRMEKMFERQGVPMSRSTLCDLFHRSADLLEPLYRELLSIVSRAHVVQADETSVKMQGTDKRAFIWTFLTDGIVAYCFSTDRSGITPRSVLEGTRGVLVVDGYTGYNAVLDVDGRTRAGCLAHARRKFHDLKDDIPEAAQALDLILDVYAVEHEARDLDLTGSEAHLELRRAKAAPAMARFHDWLTEQRSLHPPRSRMGKAVSYTLKAWDALTVFLEDVRVPVDNNRSEGALRKAALGRKNWLFVGHEAAGQNLAGLYSLVATCEAQGINPEAYLTDVIMRVSTTPQRQIAELLPQNWAPQA